MSIDFGSTDSRRMPLYFLIECGDSMRGDPIREVAQGVNLIHNDLAGNPQAIEHVNISVITYSTYAQQIVPLTPITSFILPALTAGGIHNLGNALRFLCDCINKDLIESTSTIKGDHKARVFWITAHGPTDNWSDGLEYLKKNTGKFNGIVALGVGEDVDAAILRRLTSDVLLMAEITPGKIFAFFKWISQTVTSASQPSKPANEDSTSALPPPPNGYQVKL